MPSLKLINAIVFFLIIWGTQCLVNAEKSVSFEQHVQVQQELSQLIANYIQENLPQLTNFKMHSIYTKPPRKGFMEAYFDYSFTTAVQNGTQLATTNLQGIAVLRKMKDEPQEWALEKIEIEGEAVTFDDPVVITPSKDGSAAAEATETPAAAAPAKATATDKPAAPVAPKVETINAQPTAPAPIPQAPIPEAAPEVAQ